MVYLVRMRCHDVYKGSVTNFDFTDQLLDLNQLLNKPPLPDWMVKAEHISRIFEHTKFVDRRQIEITLLGRHGPFTHCCRRDCSRNQHSTRRVLQLRSILTMSKNSPKAQLGSRLPNWWPVRTRLLVAGGFELGTISARNTTWTWHAGLAMRAISGTLVGEIGGLGKTSCSWCK